MCVKAGRNAELGKEMMKTIASSIGILAATLSLAQGQFAEPAPAERATLNAQAAEIFEALRPAVAKVRHSVVEVRVWRKRVGFGTVVAPGKVLAKWSEVKRDLRNLTCRTGDGRWLPAEVDGIYRDADLVLLEVEGLNAQPIALADDEGLKLGTFLALARPDGEAAAMGVVSVLPRSLLDSDRAFLGVEMDITFPGPGVKIRRVQPGTGADASGLRASDIITNVVGRPVNGSFELSTILQRLSPGESIRIDYRRGKEMRIAQVKLGGRPEAGRIPYSRMERMNNMGGHRYSAVRDGFRNVIQSDMQLEPEDCGAPVIDLDGNVVGVAVARAGRIKTFIVPASTVRDLLEQEGDEPEIEELAGRAEPVQDDEFVGPDPFDDLQEKIEEMQRLMEELEKLKR